MQIQAPLPISNTGLTFLTPDILIVPSCLEASLEVFRIPTSEDGGVPEYLQSFYLPELDPGYAILTFQCRGEPNPRTAITRPSRSKFLPCPESAILLFSFELGNQAGVTEHMFVVDRARLAALLPPPHPDADSDPEVRDDVLWADWGPRCARWLNGAALSMHYITTTAGQRMVAIAHDAVTRPAPIRIFDFNPMHVRALRAAPRDGVRVVEADTDIGEPVAPFAEPVRSLLPYVETSSKDLFDYAAVLINDENIIGARVCVIPSLPYFRT